MPEKTFLPYGYEPEALEIRVQAVFLDGVAIDKDDRVDAEHHQVALGVSGSWAKARFEVEVADPNDELERLVQPNETAGEALDLLIAIQGSKGRFRKGVILSHVGENRWSGEFEIFRERHRNSVAAKAIAFRKESTALMPGYASRANERVAASAEWRLYIDEKPIMPGGAIDGEWCSFREHVDLEVNTRKDCAWYLDLRDMERPRLLLNEDIENLKRTLEAPAVRGWRAQIRETVAHSMLQPVLFSLAQFALENHRELGLDDMDGWQKGILLSFARQILGVSEEAKVEAWLTSMREGDQASVLPDIATAIQRFLGMPNMASKLIGTLEGNNG